MRKKKERNDVIHLNTGLSLLFTIWKLCRVNLCAYQIAIKELGCAPNLKNPIDFYPFMDFSNSFRSMLHYGGCMNMK